MKTIEKRLVNLEEQQAAQQRLAGEKNGPSRETIPGRPGEYVVYYHRGRPLQAFRAENWDLV